MALTDVLIDELRDMYIARKTSSSLLYRNGLKAPGIANSKVYFLIMEETKGQVERLRRVFKILHAEPTGEHCDGMDGVIEEGADALEKDEEGASFDAGIIGAALRTEHYEIAGYTATIAMANTLKMSDIAAEEGRTRSAQAYGLGTIRGELR